MSGEPGAEARRGGLAARRRARAAGHPRRQRCRRCEHPLEPGVERCEACGAVAAAPGEARRSRGVIATVTLVLLAIALTLLVERPPGGLQLAAYRSADLAVLVPSGFTLTPAAAPFGTAVAAWVDPGNPATSVTVQAVAPARASAARRAAARYAHLRGLAGFVGSAPVAVSFPGGRAAVLLEYSLAGEAHALFEFSACTPSIAMAVSLTASSFHTLDELAVALPQNAEPICDGPSFTGRDRADPAIPLRVAH